MIPVLHVARRGFGEYGATGLVGVEMNGRWAWLLLALFGCAEEPVVFTGDWSCEDKPNKRPTWTFEARVQGPSVIEVFADPVFKNLVTLGTVQLEKVDGPHWIYQGKMPTNLEIGIDIGGQSIGVEENCKDVTSVLYQVVLEDGTSEDYQIKKGERGRRQ